MYYPTCVFNAWSAHLPTVILLKIDYTLLACAKKAHRFTVIPCYTIVRAEACRAARGPILKLYVVKLCYYNCYRLLDAAMTTAADSDHIWTHKSQLSQHHMRHVCTSKVGLQLMLRYQQHPTHGWHSHLTFPCSVKDEVPCPLSGVGYIIYTASIILRTWY